MVTGGITIRTRTYIVAGCGIALLAATSVAAAASVAPSKAGAAVYATAAISARHPVKAGRCGSYAVIRGAWAGGMTSPDERLAGTIVFQGRVRTNGGGTGIATGGLTVRDGRGRTRMKATLLGVVTRRTVIKGLAKGKLFGPTKNLVAIVTISFDSRYTLGGLRLGLDASENTAVTYSRCDKRR